MFYLKRAKWLIKILIEKILVVTTENGYIVKLKTKIIFLILIVKNHLGIMPTVQRGNKGPLE